MSDSSEEISAKQESEVVEVLSEHIQANVPVVTKQDASLNTLSLPAVPIKENSKSRSRSPSPSSSQTNTNEYRLSSQKSRLNILTNTKNYCIDKAFTCVEEINHHIDILKDVWIRFQNDHDQLGLACRSTLLKHEYVTTQVYERAYQQYQAGLSVCYQKKSELQEQIIARQLHQAQINPSSSNQPSSRLPFIKLPSFNGEFSEWPAFRDLFTSLVINHKTLSNVEKLHYLKASVTGSAAQLISNVTLSNESFDVAWGLITTRFDNKERQILAFVDKLFTTNNKVSKTAEDLHSLIGSTKETLDALRALDVPIDQWDYPLIHLISHRLDNNLREEWEVHRESLTPPTTFEQITTFILSRARALEALQTPKSQSSVQQSSSSSRKPVSQQSRSVHHTASSQQITAKYPCDHCKGNHYIVSCPSFRELSIQERHKVITEKRLCFNCFGHHNLRSCISTRTCVTCGGKHHTMIHPSSSSSSADQRKNQPSTSSSHD